MTGTSRFKRLHPNGLYISKIDYDNSFIDRSNPIGFFKAVIEPIDGKIWYAKDSNGYVVKGEIYFVSGCNESEIDEKIRKKHKKTWGRVAHIEVDDASRL